MSAPTLPIPGLALRVSCALLLAAAVFWPAVPAQAQVVSAFGGAFGPGLDTMSFNNLGTPSPGNDDVVGASPNWIAVNQKAFSSTAYIDMLFHVDDVGVPTTEYLVTEGVFNGTGEPWIGYRIILGFGVDTGFVQSSLGDGLGFDAPDFNSPLSLDPFTVMLPLNEDVITGVDSTFVPGGFHTFAFTVDVPAGITEFTIRQEPRNQTVSTDPATWSNVKALYR